MSEDTVRLEVTYEQYMLIKRALQAAHYANQQGEDYKEIAEELTSQAWKQGGNWGKWQTHRRDSK